MHKEFDNISSMEWINLTNSCHSAVDLGFPLDQDEALAIEETFEIDEIIEGMYCYIYI